MLPALLCARSVNKHGVRQKIKSRYARQIYIPTSPTANVATVHRLYFQVTSCPGRTEPRYLQVILLLR